MILLALDTSCDESCAAVVDAARWRLLGESVHSHAERMRRFGGIVPEVASREHLKALPLAVDEALRKAGITLAELDGIAVTNRPGLIGALLVGVSYGKALAFALGKPFSVVNHVEAHLFSPLLAGLEGGATPPFPWAALVVSGGHTELFAVDKELSFRWLGGTLDDAAGEAFDKIGKLLDLPYPAGPQIDRWVREKATLEHRKRYAFPRAKVDGAQFSFSGLKTAVALQIRKEAPLGEDSRLAVAASAQEAIVDALVDKTREAARAMSGATIVVSGGVACNSRLREKLPEAFFPAPRHCADNAAMIALVAALQFKAGTLVAAPWETTAHAQGEWP